MKYALSRKRSVSLGEEDINDYMINFNDSFENKMMSNGYAYSFADPSA